MAAERRCARTVRNATEPLGQCANDELRALFGHLAIHLAVTHCPTVFLNRCSFSLQLSQDSERRGRLPKQSHHRHTKTFRAADYTVGRSAGAGF